MLTKIRKIKNDMLHMYDVASVPEGFNYWFFKLLNYVLGMFDYSGLPESLPAREIELNLIITGHAVIFRGDDGQLVCVRTELYGYDVYYNPNKAVYGNALLRSKKLKLGDNAAVIYNNYIQGNILDCQIVDSGLLTFIKRYARMLADIESTISIRSVNSRQTSYPIAKSQAMAEQLKAFFAQQEAGQRAILTEPQILDAFRNIDIAGKQDTERINDLLIARDNILASFFRDIGVKFQQEQKRAQLTTEEVRADDQLLVINPREMLKQRRAGLDRVNALFNTSISVSINPNFERQEVQSDDSSINSNNL